MRLQAHEQNPDMHTPTIRRHAFGGLRPSRPSAGPATTAGGYRLTAGKPADRYMAR